MRVREQFSHSPRGMSEGGVCLLDAKNGAPGGENPIYQEPVTSGHEGYCPKGTEDPSLFA
jgi:hypothetical protein